MLEIRFLTNALIKTASKSIDFCTFVRLFCTSNFLSTLSGAGAASRDGFDMNATGDLINAKLQWSLPSEFTLAKSWRHVADNY